jgi:hypothetical protein
MIPCLLTDESCAVCGDLAEMFRQWARQLELSEIPATEGEE